MTTLFRNNKRCAVCGAESEYNAIGSTNSFGSSDLDLRPPEMMRSTMCYWLEACPACGYVADDVSAATDITPVRLKKPDYSDCDGIAFKSELAKTFYRRYLLDVDAGEDESAFGSARSAAWACDDVDDKENAALCRKLALEHIDSVGQDETTTLIKADMLRRAREFDMVSVVLDAREFSDPLLEKIAAFQTGKACEWDDKCYTVHDVTGG